jgi:hypothetical protein
MRVYLAAAILTALTLAAAPSQQRQCKSSCDVNYNFCMERAIGKLGHKQCRANRASCKRGCPALR